MSHPPPPDAAYKALKPFVRVWYYLTFVMLAAALLFGLFDSQLSPAWKAIYFAGEVAWAAWYAIFVIRATRRPFNANLKGISFAAAIALSLALSWVHPSFLLLTFSFYGLSFAVLPTRWAIGLVIALSAGLVFRMVSFSGGFSQNSLPIVVSFLLATFFSVMLGLYITRIIEVAREKQKMIEELEAARSDLARAERQAGVLEERQRLAGEIHDTLAQGLASVVMHLEAAEQALAGDPAAARQHLDQARSAARLGLDEARSFVWALRPELSRRETLDVALGRITGRWSQESGLAAHLELSGAPRPLPAPIEATLLRATQEALVNIHKHAHASQVNLTLTYMEDEVILDVQDNGNGFDPMGAAPAAGEERGGYGLLSLRERAIQLGGSLQVESAPGEGTTVVLGLPIK